MRALSGWRARRYRRPPEAPTVWAATSALLDYPTPELVSSLGDIRQTVHGLSPEYKEPLGRLIDFLGGHDMRDVQERYVETFDHTRRCSLYLTYFTYGDTRRRGVALVQFKQAYRRGGVEWDEAMTGGELPDHLCAVLQFGALHDADAAWQLLLQHRAGVETLRRALADRDGGQGSPWHDPVHALCATLPQLSEDEDEALHRLIQEGPPAEEVGLAPYADPATATMPEPPSIGVLGSQR